jgi:hypothetical protein
MINHGNSGYLCSSLEKQRWWCFSFLGHPQAIKNQSGVARKLSFTQYDS